MQRLVAVESITARPRFNTSMYSRLSNFFACGFLFGSESYTPSVFFLPIKITSASISAARSAAVVSVEKYGLRFLFRNGDEDHLADFEVLCAQAGVGLANPLRGHAVPDRQLVECFLRLYRVVLREALPLRLRNLQCLPGIYLCVASGVEADDVVLAHLVDAGNGIEALPFLHRVQEVSGACVTVALRKGAPMRHACQQQQQEQAVYQFHRCFFV